MNATTQWKGLSADDVALVRALPSYARQLLTEAAKERGVPCYVGALQGPDMSISIADGAEVTDAQFGVPVDTAVVLHAATARMWLKGAEPEVILSLHDMGPVSERWGATTTGLPAQGCTGMQAALRVFANLYK